MQSLQLSNGQIVRIIGLSHQLPIGYRTMKHFEVVQHKDELKTMLGQWSIVAFDHGKLDGWGYGGHIHQSYGSQCGQKFIISNACP